MTVRHELCFFVILEKDFKPKASNCSPDIAPITTEFSFKLIVKGLLNIVRKLYIYFYNKAHICFFNLRINKRLNTVARRLVQKLSPSPFLAHVQERVHEHGPSTSHIQCLRANYRKTNVIDPISKTTRRVQK